MRCRRQVHDNRPPAYWGPSGRSSGGGLVAWSPECSSHVNVFAKRARHDQVTFNLNDGTAAVPQVVVHPSGRTDAIAAAVAHPFIRGGTAAQTGTELTVTVNEPTSNSVQIVDQGGGAVQVEWNGGPVHAFTGVTTILVQAERAKNDYISFSTAPLT
jgi:hypothetical protein